MLPVFTPIYLSPTRAKISLGVWFLIFLLSLGALAALRRSGLFIPSIAMVVLWLVALFGMSMSARFAFFPPLLYRVSHEEIQVFYDAKRNGFVPQPLSIPRAQIEAIERENGFVRLQLKPGSALQIERFNRRKATPEGTIYLLDEGLYAALQGESAI